MTVQAQQLEKDMKRLQDKKEPADWLSKANDLREQLIAIKEKQVDPLVAQAAAHDDRAGELLKSSKALVERLGVAGDGTVVFRASAIYYASKGHETAEKLAEFYRKHPDDRQVLHDEGRAFADLAVAGRFAQPRITPGDRDKGVAAAEEALKKNPKLLRAHLFLAKIYLANHEYPLALAEADKLIALNPAHGAVVKLKAEIDQAAKAADKLPESK
jgi:tetratricopeptide (TPR) repeat protein